MQSDLKEIYKKLLGFAILAPSPDNSQPWSFRFKGESLLLIHDTARSDYLYNVKNVASYVTFGAVIENISIAADHFGYLCKIAYFTDKDEPDIIASISIEKADTDEDPLFAFLSERCVNRKSYDGRALDGGILKELKAESGSQKGVEIQILDSKVLRRKVAALVGKGDIILFENQGLLSGLVPWLRWSRGEVLATKDGMSIESLEINIVKQRLFRVIKSWPWTSFFNKLGFSKVVAYESSGLIKSSSGVFLIASSGTEPLDYIKGGRVLQRFWLRAASLGMALQPMTGITFLSSMIQFGEGSRLGQGQRGVASEIFEGLKDLFKVTDGNGLIMLGRIGFAKPPSDRSLRRPVQDVLDEE